ncbi:hypothetical protein O1611_g4770 [Lasiodiplodia mahajangana]|uniref:Uncharacterized protein n=1 Tax=Lasiodiplodia mahajangana TaxID=1108764 RepID=A0ACC2JNN3_9PEZI|nr:hypothetical protein O1611_g4770 [Lasiodiplodia mahajangana]
MVWVYMPIAPQDRIISLGFRETGLPHSILIQMSLAGKVILGRCPGRPGKDVLLASGTPLALIYGEPYELESHHIFGAYPSSSGDTPLFAMREVETDREGPYFSWAPLTHIQSVNTFSEWGTGLCKGIIFHYRNGGSRALGQCRLKVDQSVVVEKPCVLCFQTTLYSTADGKRWDHARGVRVEVTGDDSHQHSDSEWKCIPLGSGVLTFSFNEDSSWISVREESPMTE